MCYTETELLDRTLAVLDTRGAAEAYAFLAEHAENTTERGSQTYNFLSCLAAINGERERALRWLDEAVLERGYWYRPEVFQDEDLDSIRDDAAFRRCEEISRERYEAALRSARTLVTRTEGTGERLALCLHGNQQNAVICAQDWAFLHDMGWRTACVQSRTPDSYALYRWEDGDAPQLADVIGNPSLRDCVPGMLCGFSSGCGEILRALPLLTHVPGRLALVSPWIPDYTGSAAAVLAALISAETRVSLTCGAEDKDCLPLAQSFAAQASDAGVPVRFSVIEGAGHVFPPELADLLRSFM